MINDRRDAIIRRNFKEIGFELITSPNVDRNDIVRQLDLLKKHGDLVTIWCGPIVKVNHG
jgi:hypothetical protein